MSPYDNPSIDIFGLRVDEPITVFTDLIVAAIGIYAFYKTKSHTTKKYILYYRYFFLLTGISTLIGGLIGHAFAYSLGPNAKYPGWIVAIAGVVFAQFAVLFHTREAIGEWFFSKLFILNILEIVAALVLLIIYKSFAIVEIHTAFGLVLIVSALEGINYSKTKSVLSKNIILGVGFAIVGVSILVFKVALSKWFNHKDISHLFIALSLFLMYKGLITEQNRSANNTVNKNSIV